MRETYTRSLYTSCIHIQAPMRNMADDGNDDLAVDATIDLSASTTWISNQ